jgi:hypothetical protein
MIVKLVGKEWQPPCCGKDPMDEAGPCGVRSLPTELIGGNSQRKVNGRSLSHRDDLPAPVPPARSVIRRRADAARDRLADAIDNLRPAAGAMSARAARYWPRETPGRLVNWHGMQ